MTLCGRRCLGRRACDAACAGVLAISNRIMVTAARGLHTMSPSRCPGMKYPDEKYVYDYPQPCGHRLSGDLSGFGALASEGRCMTSINRADSASEKFCPTICAGPTSICGDRSCACMTGLNHQRPTTPTVDGVIVMPSPEFPPSCQCFRADVFAQQTVDAIDGRGAQRIPAPPVRAVLLYPISTSGSPIHTPRPNSAFVNPNRDLDEAMNRGDSAAAL